MFKAGNNSALIALPEFYEHPQESGIIKNSAHLTPTYMNPEKNWYAVYTRPRWEKKTAIRLADLQIETYCPLKLVVRNWSDRKKIIREPLFTSYCFVRIMASEYPLVRQTTGVLNFVYWLGKPAVIKEEEINAIKKLMNEYSDVRTELITAEVNDRIRITSGILTDQEGKILEVKNNSVRVLLPSLGVAIIAEVEKNNIELVQKGRIH